MLSKLDKSALLSWYRSNKRDLPWRREPKDPYRIWVSEIMLQQTTVQVVLPFYERFLKAFPTVSALAKASEERVNSLWSGLGYYSRARNLQKSAKVIAKFDTFPSTYDQLLELPGIGPYTAAAIASIAFGEEVACVDGNVSRVLSRLYDIPDDVTSPKGIAKIRTLAQDFILGQPPSEHNQAMMELGATICTPKSPTCLLCPLMNSCESFKKGTIEQRPVKKKVKKQIPWVWEVDIVENKGRIALVKSDNGTPWLKNTWVIPGRALPLNGEKPPSLHIRHSITHHKIFVTVRRKKTLSKTFRGVKWVRSSDIKNLGVSSIVMKILLSEGLIAP